MNRICIKATSLWLLIALALFVQPCTAQHIPSDFGPKPTFAEEFDANSLDLARWSYRGLGKRNHCINAKNAVQVVDGYLRITTYSDGVNNGQPVNYCGMISTENGFHGRYGYWEAAVRFHQVPGMQCAFWLQSPTTGKMIGDARHSGVEMDIFEHLAEASPQEYDHALHWDGYGAAHKQLASKRTLDSLQDGKFHRFALAWRPSGYTFLVDDEVTYEVPASGAPVSDVPEYMILSSEVPRDFPRNGFGGQRLPEATFDVDYVRMYPYLPKKKGTPFKH